MKNLLVGLVLTLVAALAGAWSSGQFEKKPELIYSLSAPIPVQSIKALNPKLDIPPLVRQLEIKNIGDDVAKKVQVRIDGEVNHYYIEKSSEADSPEVFQHDESFEVVYPELPVDASFKIIFSAFVSEHDIDIRHKGGAASPALKPSSHSWADIFFSMLVYAAVLSIIGMLLSEYFSAYADIPRSGLFGSVEKILSSKKPWYMPEKSWANAICKALELSIANAFYYSGDISALNAYQLLSSNKPEVIPQKEWEGLVDSASEILKREFRTAASSGQESWVLNLLSIQKPQLFPEGTWIDLIRTATDKWITLNIDRVYSLQSALEALSSEKPEIVTDATWKKLRNAMAKKYFTFLRDELRVKKEPIKWLGSQDISVLDSDQKTILEDQAYRFGLEALPKVEYLEAARSFLKSEKPEWLKDNDYHILRDRAERTCKLHELEKLESELNEREQSLKENEKLLAKNIDKVERQLKIIHDLLSDPASIDQVEDYSNPFAPGNFRALKKLADSLKESS